ncbi:hypothetical protein U879_05390 [Defluviimonas sp. 20V17]|uniref:Cu+-exporting ATPase n=1 Tax=Allgaiera indica TaxID=765699 RepID=A0AAN5A1A5_9RHOB|nr:cation transporter [Allgaiera indica]KDB04699.1 hypothetical protein U879_05390 [Defluviimonas sp. 20V17]GHE05929.1 hypothetical protein GCM10008024_38530 [Allgaiera indica]SDX81015.1 Cu+-exporting ATPase [Allgaiera indica]
MQKQLFGAALALGLAAAPRVALASDSSTVILDVHHAGCVLCGPIIKSSLLHVPGVNSVAVSQPNGLADVTATIAYDPTQTTPTKLIKVVTNRGYPAEVK